MSTHRWSYAITELPNPAYPAYLYQAGGDVCQAIDADNTQMLRMLADFPPASVTITLRYLFCPDRKNHDPQQRLKIYLDGQAHRRQEAASLSLLLSNGPLRRFYPLEPTEKVMVNEQSFLACCDIQRRQTLLAPTVSGEFNARVLPAYFSIQSFQPNRTNNYLRFDSMLNNLTEPVYVELCAEPVDVRPQLACHTKYLAQLQQINRPWDRDEEGESSSIPYDRDNWSALLSPLEKKELLADHLLRQEQKFHETLTLPHLRFHLRVFAPTAALARLLASVIAESAFEEGSYQLVVTEPNDPQFTQLLADHETLHAITVPALPASLTDQMPPLFEELTGLSHLAPVTELTGAIRLPIAAVGSPCCIRANTDPPHEDIDTMIVQGIDLQNPAMTDLSANNTLPRGISETHYTSHGFICGTTGCAKTTSSTFNHLYQLSAKHTPWIVFEAGCKRDYRALKCLKNHPDPALDQLARELQIFTPGDESVSPFRHNPLDRLPSVSQDQWISDLICCFEASMPMFEPLPEIIAESLERVYDQYADLDHPPLMVDLYRTAREVLAEKGYSPEVESNLRAALEVRLGGLTRRSVGRIFQCRHNVPDLTKLVQGHSIIELASLTQPQQCLLTLFKLSTIGAWAKTTARSGQGTRLAIFLEEAHNIVGRHALQSATGENQADPAARAAEFVCRMLAEWRGLGIAVFIIDQLPSAVAGEVIKNTASKVAFRQVDKEDRDLLGAAMLLNPLDQEEIARLAPGEAYFYTQGYFGPRRIRTPHLVKQWQLDPAPVGEAIMPWIGQNPWFMAAQRQRVRAELDQLFHQMDRFDTLRQQVSEQTCLLRDRYTKIRVLPQAQQSNLLPALNRKALGLQRHLKKTWDAFRRDSYLPLLGSSNLSDTLDEGLPALRLQLIDRFEAVLKPATLGCLKILDTMRQTHQSNLTNQQKENKHGKS